MPMSRTAIDLYNLKIPVAAIKAAIAGGGGTVTSANITDATTAGRALLTAANTAAARTVLGGGAGGVAVFAAADAAAVRTVIRPAQITALTAVATPDGSDAATTQTLANALKVAVNAIITAVKA